MRSFSVLGNIAVVNFPEDYTKKQKLDFAHEVLRKNKSVKTVVEKSGDFKGRLRKMKVSHILGERNLEALYKENGCTFRFNIEDTYFSSRLSNERKELASKIKPNEEVIVMFAGVAPFPIILAKHSSAKKIYSNELNRKANQYAKLNIQLNKLRSRVELLPGDIKRISQGLKKKFDVIVMPRPQLKSTFLSEAFHLSKKGTRVYYYDFCRVEDIENIVERIRGEAKERNRKIKILNVKSAGEIAPFKVRVRVDFQVL